MSINIKRGLLIVSIIVLTVVCYLIMNRNYDPLSRYPYTLTDEQKETILDNMNELEIKYIIDYSISPGYFMDFVNNYYFNAYYSDLYYKAKNKLILCNNDEVVTIVNRIESKGLDFDTCMEEFQYMFYNSIMERLAS